MKAIALVLVLLCAACGEQTGVGLDLVPEPRAERMGLQAWREIRAATPASGDASDQRRAQAVADAVLAAAGESPADWEVVVFQGPQANAFALPGNKIGVYEGMMRLADTDARLAAVLAHEVAHNQERHAVERMSSAVAAQAGTDLAGAVLGAAGVGSPGTVSTLLDLGAQYGLLLPYSRNQELEADRLGLNIMARAGFDPRAAVTLWRDMDRSGGQPPAFLSTHPNPGQRIEQLQAFMPEALATYRAHD
ncbi:MAG: M48 family metallopeptidase [Alphaproteobacteria bacterium]|nr:M48 family metallopeptidase [Alphaproteobacteria bacterium]